jgi:hypothetical protein
MMEHTYIQELIYHLDKASDAAFKLKDETDLPVVMTKLYRTLDGHVADLTEYEANLPTNNDQ